MEVSAKAWRLIVANYSVMSLRYFWEREEYLEKHGINYSTYHNYVNGRSTLYVQTRRWSGMTTKETKNTTSLNNDAVHQTKNQHVHWDVHLIFHFWRRFSQLNIVADEHFLDKICKRDKETGEQENYRRGYRKY